MLFSSFQSLSVDYITDFWLHNQAIKIQIDIHLK